MIWFFRIVTDIPGTTDVSFGMKRLNLIFHKHNIFIFKTMMTYSFDFV